MTNQQMKETLEKQLQLLSEGSQRCKEEDLASLTSAMLRVCAMLMVQEPLENILAKEGLLNAEPDAVAKLVSQIAQEENMG